jgi:hypothetical protein
MKTFKEYIITESLKPIETIYGWINDELDFVPNEIDEDPPKVIRTLFNYQGNYYLVFFDIEKDMKCNLGFTKVKDIKFLPLGFKNNVYEQVNSNVVSIGIFNRVLYVALELMKIYGIEEFGYHAPEGNLNLNSFYNKINNNTQFKKELTKLGLSTFKEEKQVGEATVTEFTVKKD